MTNEQPEDLSTQADKIIPFTLDANSLNFIIQEFMIAGDYTPEDLVQKGIISRQRFVYVPYYFYNCEYKTHWSASFGFSRQEAYTDPKDKAVQKTRTVLDWQPAKGDLGGACSFLLYAGQDKKRPGVLEKTLYLPDKSADFLSRMRPFEPTLPAGQELEPFVQPPDQAFDKAIRGDIEAMLEKGVKAQAKGDKQKDWQWTKDIAKEVVKVYLPVAQGYFTYQGKEYGMWVDGTDLTRRGGDNLPEDKGKKRAVWRGVIPLLLTILALVVCGLTLRLSAVSVWAPVALAVGVLYYLLRSRSMRSYSKRVRNKLLDRKLEGDNTASPKEQLKVPYFADKHNDKVVLTVVSLICLLIYLVPLGIKQYSLWTESTPLVQTTPAPAVKPAPPQIAPLIPPGQPAPAPAPKTEPAPSPAPAAPLNATPGASFAPSFNCTRAMLPVEHIICSDPELAGLDMRLNQLYNEVRQKTSDPEGLRTEQNAWLTDIRNACQTAECLKIVYQDRLESLQMYE